MEDIIAETDPDVLRFSHPPNKWPSECPKVLWNEVL